MGKAQTSPATERRITDLTLAAFLSSRKHEILQIEPNSGRSVFVFRHTPELAQDELRFFNRQGSVEPLSFAETLRYFRAAVR